MNLLTLRTLHFIKTSKSSKRTINKPTAATSTTLKFQCDFNCHANWVRNELTDKIDSDILRLKRNATS